MTDQPDRDGNVLPFQPKRRPQPLALPEAKHLAVRAYLNETPGIAQPLAAVLEYDGERLGCLGTFDDSPQGRAAAQAVVRIAILTIDLLAPFTPPAGGRGA